MGDTGSGQAADDSAAGELPQLRDITKGVAVALAFLSAAVVLVLEDNYFENPTATRLAAIVVAIIGVGGLGIELNKLAGSPKKWSLDSLGIGLSLVAVWAVIYSFWGGWWFLNLITLPVLFFGMYGIWEGILTTSVAVFMEDQTTRQIAAKAAVALPALIGTVFVTLQILVLLGFIDDGRK